jgi:hypothetical protein
MTNGGGTYFAPQFDTAGVSDLAPFFMADGGWQGNGSDYTTSVVGNVSMAWLRKVAQGARPWFGYFAPKACHEPFTPAAWYAAHWDAAWPATEPRPASWNCSMESRQNHHGVIATNPLISEKCGAYVTKSFMDRWRSLMSVDDLIEAVVTFVEANATLAANTYVYYRVVLFSVFTSLLTPLYSFPLTPLLVAKTGTSSTPRTTASSWASSTCSSTSGRCTTTTRASTT